MIIKAQGAAHFAEEYLINSIWRHDFPPGSILPSERELSEKIGVTRTTLREVLQRLARDGWLSIQHGKPTRVNDIWATANLNILETIVKIENNSAIVPFLIDNLLSARTNIATIFINKAFVNNPEQSLQCLTVEANLSTNALEFAELDYNIFRGLAFASGNPIYGLIINGLRGLYIQIGENYFSDKQAISCALDFYQELKQLIHDTSLRRHEKVSHCIRLYGKKSGEIWQHTKHNMFEKMVK